MQLDKEEKKIKENPNHKPKYTTYDIEYIKQNASIDLVMEGRQGIDMYGRIKYKCPFHKNGNEKNPSFVWNKDDRYYKCFTCGASGDILTLYQQLHNTNFQETLKILSSF